MATVKAAIRENATSTSGEGDTLSGTYGLYSKTWTVRPSDSQPFTKTDIDNLQIGAALTGFGGSSSVTQVYVVIDYTEPSASGGFFAFM